MKKEQIIAQKIADLYSEMVGYYTAEQAQQYDDLVDEMVKITQGKAPAKLTDPLVFEDFKDLSEDKATMIYNEMCDIVCSDVYGD
jgi:chromosome condensin MukBEF complex kleisin-like MukF subunit